jgi:thiazole synthase
MGLGPWVKLELTPEPKYLLPDPAETLKAAEQLIKEGFVDKDAKTSALGGFLV